MIKLTFDTWGEVVEFAKDITKNMGTSAAPEPAPTAKTTKASKAQKAAAPAPEEAPTPAPAATPASAAAPEPAPWKVTKQDVQTKAIQLMDSGKQAQLQQLLAKYNVPALPSLDESQLAGFMADMEAL